jgi:hypothetical protein
MLVKTDLAWDIRHTWSLLHWNTLRDDEKGTIQDPRASNARNHSPYNQHG